MDINTAIDFLRFCLHDDMPLPSSAERIDWNQLLDFGIKQGIVGVLFHGIKKLKPTDPHPSVRELALWGTENSRIIETNKEVYSDAYHITSIIYKRYGHRSCILKGQGNALMYPDPYMRKAGDIDLWIVPNNGETIDDIIRLCRKISPGCDLEYHHAQMDDNGHTPVEIHYRPSFNENIITNNRLQHYFDSVREEQVKTIVDLPDGLGKISVPTNSFNRVFQLSHMMKHFLFEGIGLRHIIDYYYLLLRGTTNTEKAEFAKLIKPLGLTKFARGMMYVMKYYLGLDDKYLLVKPNRRIGRFIMSEVMKTGNFGRGDDRFTSLNSSNRFIDAFYSIIKPLRFLFEFPGEAIFGHSTWILWWHFYYRKKIDRVINNQK